MAVWVAVDQRDAWLDRPVLQDAPRHRFVSSAAAHEIIGFLPERNKHRHEQVYRVYRNDIGVHSTVSKYFVFPS